MIDEIKMWAREEKYAMVAFICFAHLFFLPVTIIGWIITKIFRLK